MKKNRLQSLLDWTLDNLFDLLTIAIAVVLVVRYQVTPPTPDDIPEIATWILGVLGLLAVSGLWERNRRLRRIEKLTKESRDLSRRYLNKRAHASDFFLPDRRLTAKDLSSADYIYFAGKVLARTTREFMHVLGQRLATGATIRFIILDPQSETLLEQAVLQSFDAPADFWYDTLSTTETVIEALAKSPNNKGKVEIGYLPYMPSFGLILVDPNQPHGICLVELYQHKSAAPHPTFELRASDDPHWFKFFNKQFERMWDSCRVKTLR